MGLTSQNKQFHELKSLEMLLLLVLVSTTAFAKPSFEKQWDDFKERHGKSYASLTEENLRREVWREEMEMVEKHNKEAESCGSCWAFAAVGAVEGGWAKEKGQLYRLSEQELIDCDKSDGGCNGGGISSALTWVHNHHGLAKNTDYGVGHYLPSQGNCHHKEEETVASLTRVRHVASKNEADLKRAVHNAGPVAMSVHVNKKFKAYKSGIFNDSDCPKNSANHAMLTVGWKYSTKYNKTKWIVKNSWGKSWGQDGYIFLEYGKNVCGMAKSPLYAEV